MCVCVCESSLITHRDQDNQEEVQSAAAVRQNKRVVFLLLDPLPTPESAWNHSSWLRLLPARKQREATRLGDAVKRVEPVQGGSQGGDIQAGLEAG